MTRFKYVRLAPDELASGRPLAFGDYVDLTAREVAHNRRLIEAGALIPAPRPRRRRAAKKRRA